MSQSEHFWTWSALACMGLIWTEIIVGIGFGGGTPVDIISPVVDEDWQCWNAVSSATVGGMIVIWLGITDIYASMV